MVEVLIISYNALPMDVVSSYRAKAYCDHLISFGIRPTLLTHRWERCNDQFQVHQPDDSVVMEESNDFRVIRLPYPGVKRSPSVVHTIWSYLCGNLDVGLEESYRIFKTFLWDHLKKQRYQLVIAIYNPHFHLKLAYKCWRKFDIPYVLDFRDLWNNEIVTSSYDPGIREKVINSIISRWWRRWIRDSVFFSTTGNKWRDYLFKLSGKDGIIVRNGFDDLKATFYIGERAPNKKFKIIHFGRMYHGQDVDVFLNGFKAFAVRFSPSEVEFEVIGLKKTLELDYQNKIKKTLGPYVTFRPYMSKADLLVYCAEHANLFFFPGFRGDNGSFAVKVYDYVIIGKNIVVAPGGGEVGRFVSDTNAGVVLDDSQAVTDYLEKVYGEFIKSGSIAFNVNREILRSYSREMQVSRMAEKINSLFSKK